MSDPDTPPRRPATPADGTDLREIVVVAPSALGDSIVTALGADGARAVRLASFDDALARVRPSTLALMVALTDAPTAAREVCRRVHGHAGGRRVPLLFVVERGDLSDSDARRLHDFGATAVLQWPEDAGLLRRFLPELLALPLETADEPDATDALRAAIHARLQGDRVLADKVDVRVHGGVAVLRGAVPSAWARSRLSRIVAAVPGITGVIDLGVIVDHPDVDDEALQASVDETLCSVGNIEGRGLRATVRDGVAVIGAAADDAVDPEVVTRVCNAVQQIPGVRRVLDWV
ncbi:MAG: BON domain-containing protein [Deltaproteobacteria bacterium]|nr:BON domain-containing protein [Deltaproteobacteria bacterium]